MDLWVRYQTSLENDAKFEKASNLFERVSKAGYTGVVLGHCAFDTPWSISGAEKSRLFALKHLADIWGIEIIPHAWSVGYGTMCNVNDDLIETVAISNAPFVAHGDRIVPENSPVEFPNGDLETFNLKANRFSGWGADMPGVQSFVDLDVKHSGKASLRMETGKDPHRHARFSRHVSLTPGRRYLFTAHFRAKDMVPKYEAIAMMVILDGGVQAASKEVNRLEEPEGWRKVSLEFCSGESSGAYVYCGSWTARSGTFWVDDVTLEETGPRWLSYRSGDPISLRNAKTGRVYELGRDYKRLKTGSKEVSFERPQGSEIADGEHLLLDAFVCSRSGPKMQFSTCMSDPKLYDCFRRAAKWVHEKIRPKHWFLSLDEVRNGGTCPLCLARKTDMAHILGECVRSQRDILKETDPDVGICAWSDMFDPLHNAKATYYGCRGSFVGIWDVIPKDVAMMLWWGKIAPKSAQFFSERGFSLYCSVCVDSRGAAAIEPWKREMKTRPNFKGFLYTTWCDDFSHLEEFAKAAREGMDDAEPAPAGEKAGSAK